MNQLKLESNANKMKVNCALTIGDNLLRWSSMKDCISSCFLFNCFFLMHKFAKREKRPDMEFFLFLIFLYSE